MKEQRFVIAKEKGSLLLSGKFKLKKEANIVLPTIKKRWINAVIEKRIVDIPKYSKEDLEFASKFSKAINGAIRQ